MENNDVLYWEEAREKLAEMIVRAELEAIAAKPPVKNAWNETDWWVQGVFAMGNALIMKLTGTAAEAEGNE